MLNVALEYVPGLELRLGQFKTPFGYEQQESDTKLMWVYGSYVVSALARGRDSRDIGALLTGKWKVRGLGLELAAAGVNGALPNGRDDLNEKNFWGRAGVSYAARGVTARAGGSFGYGDQVQSLGADARFGSVGTVLDDTYFHFHTVGADVTLDGRWFFASAEYVQSRRDVREYASPTDVERSEVTARGWTAGIHGKTPWNGGPVFRVEQYDRNDASRATDDVAERYTFGAYYDVRPANARLLVNYELDRSDDPVRTGDRLAALLQVIF
ncbi:MAG TPA: hypothetical protein VD838_05815 [Anaeromyxobacteraceae bacterium]|nr:hypothetical protein [Anaeromyxobacteraceae bacterium]